MQKLISLKNFDVLNVKRTMLDWQYSIKLENAQHLCAVEAYLHHSTVICFIVSAFEAYYYGCCHESIANTYTLDKSYLAGYNGS